MLTKREFLAAVGGTVLAGGTGTLGIGLLAAHPAQATRGHSTRMAGRWGMVIDLQKCLPDCTECMAACRQENNVALHGDDRWDVHWIRKVQIRSKHSQSSLQRNVILMCNHCDNPPCAQVCPVQATYKRDDGVVLVDHHRCIGCRYCVMSCPYNARYFNFKENRQWPNRQYPKRSHGVAESCNFCAHLLDRGLPPACVARCREIGVGALTHGDLDDPASEVSQLIDRSAPKRIREDLGTEPKIYYVGL